MDGRTRASDDANDSVSGNPPRASAMAGSTRRFHGSFPCAFHARWSPATVPGTPTERWLPWCLTASYFPSLRNIVGVAAAGAFSRKS